MTAVLVSLATLGLVAGLAWLGARSIELFVLGVLLTRTGVDALDTVVPWSTELYGVVVLAVGGTWLAARWRSGALTLSPLGRAVIAFVAAALVAVVIAPDLPGALVEWSRVATIGVMLLVVEQLATGQRFRRRVVVAVLVAAIAPVLVALHQAVTGTGLLEAGGFRRVTGTLVHPNPLAAFGMLVVVLLTAVAVHHGSVVVRWGLGTAGAVVVVVVHLTYTRAAWIAVVLGVATVAALASRRLLVATAALVCLMVLLVPGSTARFADLADSETPRGESGNSWAWRLDYWGGALDLAQESPLTGIGLKQVAAQSEEAKQPHNDILRAYVEMGVLGLLAYVWLLTRMARTAGRAVRAARSTGRRDDVVLAAACAGTVVGYVAMCLVANLMSQVVVGLYLAAIVGAAGGIAHPAGSERPRTGRHLGHARAPGVTP